MRGRWSVRWMICVSRGLRSGMHRMVSREMGLCWSWTCCWRFARYDDDTLTPFRIPRRDNNNNLTRPSSTIVAGGDISSRPYSAQKGRTIQQYHISPFPIARYNLHQSY